MTELTRYYYIFIISQLWLTSHLRSTVFLLDTGTPGTSREIYSDDANGETRTRNPSIISQILLEKKTCIRPIVHVEFLGDNQNPIKTPPFLPLASVMTVFFTTLI